MKRIDEIKEEIKREEQNPVDFDEYMDSLRSIETVSEIQARVREEMRKKGKLPVASRKLKKNWLDICNRCREDGGLVGECETCEKVREVK